MHIYVFKKFGGKKHCNKYSWKKKKRYFRRQVPIIFDNDRVYITSFLSGQLIYLKNSLGSITCQVNTIFSNIFLYSSFFKNKYMVKCVGLVNILSNKPHKLSNNVYVTTSLVYNSIVSLGSAFGSIVYVRSASIDFIDAVLPSGQSRIFKKELCLVGLTNSYRKKRVKICVRGIVKNPVDHPNGGSSKSRSPFFTPWGKVAKYGK